MISCKKNTYKELKCEEIIEAPVINNNYDSIIIYGGPYFSGYKYDKIKSDSIIYSLNNRIVGDTLNYKKDFDSTEEKYFIDAISTYRIINIFDNEKPKWYNDYDPPLPEAIYPFINVLFYKGDSVYKEKDFLIVSDTFDYSNNFYKAVDFLYKLQIKNVQNENIEDFVKNYKW